MMAREYSTIGHLLRVLFTLNYYKKRILYGTFRNYGPQGNHWRSMTGPTEDKSITDFQKGSYWYLYAPADCCFCLTARNIRVETNAHISLEKESSFARTCGPNNSNSNAADEFFRTLGEGKWHGLDLTSIALTLCFGSRDRGWTLAALKIEIKNENKHLYTYTKQAFIYIYFERTIRLESLSACRQLRLEFDCLLTR